MIDSQAQYSRRLLLVISGMVKPGNGSDYEKLVLFIQKEKDRTAEDVI